MRNTLIILGIVGTLAFGTANGATIGYTTIGASSLVQFDNRMYTSKGVPADTSTFTSTSAYLTEVTGTSHIKGVITINDGVTFEPITIVANGIGGATDVTTAAWYTSTFGTPPTATAGTTYYPGYVMDENSDVSLKYDTSTGANSYQDSSNSYASPANPACSGFCVSTAKFSIYGTIADVGGGGAANTPHIIFLQGVLQSGILQN